MKTSNMLVRGAWLLATLVACDGPAPQPAGPLTSTRELQQDDDAGIPDGRDAYAPCELSEECPGANALCAAYGNEPGRQFCADYCERDKACPVLPGFRSICNFAWCAVRCKDEMCPNGMTCIRDQSVLDSRGISRGSADICVPNAEQ